MHIFLKVQVAPDKSVPSFWHRFLDQHYILFHVVWSVLWETKVCHEIFFQQSGAYISVSKYFTENLKVPSERPWKMQTFDIWYIFVGQILLGLHQSN